MKEILPEPGNWPVNDGTRRSAVRDGSVREGRIRTAVFHPHFKLGGGSESKAAWSCQAAREFGQVTLVSDVVIDLKAVDRFFGTSIAAGGVEVECLPPAFRTLRHFDALSAYRLGRWAKAKRGEYDIMISTYNPMDFGRPGIQSLADVSFDDGLRRRYHPQASGLKGLFYRRSPLRSAYLALGRAMSGQSDDGWLRNLTVANSEWTKQVYDGKYPALRTVVIYPPVADFPPGRPWLDRENGFVVMSRIVPEKRIETAIEAVRALRRAGFDIHLHILGRGDDGQYLEHIERLCRESGGWARYEGLLYGAEKAGFLGGHRFGISGCEGEAFGISVAEMIKAGMVVWVPASGGQVEIVDHPDLVFGSADEASVRILSVLRDEARLDGLREHLARRAELFSTGRFVADVRSLLSGFLDDDMEHGS